MPDEIIGDIPNSINVPRLLAIIIRSQYRGSEVSDDTIPYNLHTLVSLSRFIFKVAGLKHLRHLAHHQEYQQCQLSHSQFSKFLQFHCIAFQLTPVHIIRWLNGTLRSGAATSGKRGTKGFMRSRNRTVPRTISNCRPSPTPASPEWLLLTSAHDCCIWVLNPIHKKKECNRKRLRVKNEAICVPNNQRKWGSKEERGIKRLAKRPSGFYAVPDNKSGWIVWERNGCVGNVEKGDSRV